MKDYRTTFIKETEQNLLPILDSDTLKRVINTITITLNNYEITARCTNIVPCDSQNEAILKRYLACLLIDGKSKRTVKLYHFKITKLSDFLGKDFREMDAYDIRFYFANEKERGISAASLKNTRSVLCSFFTWMEREEIIQKNPFLKINQIKAPTKEKQAFTSVEIDMLKAHCARIKERAIIEVLLSSGVRVSELCDLDVDDIDFQSLSLHVRHGKGDKERTTYISPVASTYLQEYLSRRSETGPALLCNNRHERLCSSGVQKILKTIASRAGVENVHPHRFRRTFATDLARMGMEIQEIQKLLGHTDVNTTMTYICVDDEKVRASYKRYIA